jgi:DNA polymerase delta subunit 1
VGHPGHGMCHHALARRVALTSSLSQCTGCCQQLQSSPRGRSSWPAPNILSEMPATAVAAQKRVLGDSSSASRNVVPSPNSAKKRKLDAASGAANRLQGSQGGQNGKLLSSQPKSQFEEEVLEKLTQDMSSLKQRNSEKDQQWDRPSLDDFDDQGSLCFQQIETEEGNLFGGKTTIRLFGVTEV